VLARWKDDGYTFATLSSLVAAAPPGGAR